MHFHQKIHDYLLNYRTNFDSSFNFIVRQRASTKDKNYPGGKFAQGLVFQGTNDYCFVGLVDKSGGANATKSVGLVFKPIQDGFTVNLDIVFPGETDQSLVGFYKSLASKFDDIRWDPKGTRAYKIIGDFEEGKPQLIYDWLQQYYPIIKQVAIESKIPDLIINDQKFQELQDNSQRKLKEARKPVENKITKSEKKYWLLSPGRNAIMWDKFYEEGYMALGWDELGDLTEYSNRESIRDALRGAYGGEGNKMNDVTANWEFANDMSPGDVVIIKKGRSTLLGYGIITSEYYHESNYKYHNRRKVNWIKKGIWDIDHSMVLKTLTDVSSYTSDVENYEYYYEWLMSKMDSVKEKFLDWFYSRPEIKYKDISSERISLDLDDSNTYFDIDIFSVDQNNYLQVIEILNEARTNKEGAFYKFSKGTGTHRPGALLGKENYQKFLLEYFMEHESSYEMKGNDQNNSLPINQILYGPPGTGKTYNTVTEAVAIIQNKTFEELKRLGRKIVKKEFDALSKKGQILFTTFHQSMSYEDFVEGIKPTLIEDTEKETQQVSYDVIGGIFKLAAARAAYNSYKEFHTESNLSYTYSQLHEAFIEMAREKISKDDLLVCETKNGSFVEIFRINKNDSIQARAKGSHVTSVAPLTKENIQKLYDTYKSVDQINHLQEVRDVVEVSPRTTEFYAVFKALLEFEKKSFKPDKETEELKEIDLTDEEVVRQFDSGVFTEVSRKHGRNSSKVVLVIDEINRGNVSAIFGELITLLEEDKRLGEPNQLYITLPYSKKQFSVPSNLYVIGTMNTADRSVEALDTALRRRFTFKELMPNPSLLSDIQFDGFTLEEVLKTINERIEVLVDRDHTIGHSYFLSIDSGDIEALSTVFQNKIIPLLQEYFYHDYEKMALILGTGFVEQKKNNEVKFASFENLDIPPIDNQLVLKDTIDYIEQAILLLLNKSDNQKVTKE